MWVNSHPRDNHPGYRLLTVLQQEESHGSERHFPQISQPERGKQTTLSITWSLIIIKSQAELLVYLLYPRQPRMRRGHCLQEGISEVWTLYHIGNKIPSRVRFPAKLWKLLPHNWQIQHRARTLAPPCYLEEKASFHQQGALCTVSFP